MDLINSGITGPSRPAGPYHGWTSWLPTEVLPVVSESNQGIVMGVPGKTPALG